MWDRGLYDVWECNDQYIGNCFQLALHVHFNEHADGKCPDSEVCERNINTCYCFFLNGTRVLVRDDNFFTRKIRGDTDLPAPNIPKPRLRPHPSPPLECPFILPLRSCEWPKRLVSKHDCERWEYLPLTKINVLDKH